MEFTEERLKQLDNPALTPDEQAVLRCRAAAGLIHVGKYEAARDAFGELWQGIGNRPKLKGLSITVSAEVLLQCGVLSGWLGSVKQIPDAQEKAKDLLTKSLRQFQSQRQKSKVAEVQYEMGMCYFRLGAYDEARVIIDEAINSLAEDNAELKAKALIRRTLVDIWTGRYHAALDILRKAEPFFERCSDAIKGKWHGQMGLALDKLANAERSTDYLDRAIIEYTAAIYHYEQAEHERYCAVNLNNIAMLLYEFEKHGEAHAYLDRAISVAARLNDKGLLAQMNETRARVLIAEQRYQEANRVIVEVIQTFEKGGESALLADALTIQGIAWARLRAFDHSIHALRRAMNVAQDSGASSNAALAALTLIEEHGATRLSDIKLYRVYRRADNWLKDTQDAELMARLRVCARLVIERLSGAKLSDKGFSLPDVVSAYEAKFIEQALELEQGSVSRAAKRLGIKHQSLASLLSRRHKSLLEKRTPPFPRKRSVIPEPGEPVHRKRAKKSHTIIILHVEDSEAVADAVKDILDAKGWKVEGCSDGVAALRELAGEAHYDLLLFDNELPSLSGLELVRTARKLPHRHQTPIAMFSASNCEAEAWEAGVDAFLRKPEDTPAITPMIERLLARGLGHKS